MSDQHQPGTLILGGGLAGSFLACRMLQRGCRVWVIDDLAPNSASRVAAGLYNVITGRFGAKTWMAETLLAELYAFLEDPFFERASQFVHPQEIYRPFRDIDEYNRWSSRSADPEYRHLVAFEERPLWPEILHNPLGGIRILPCGWVDIGGLIGHLHQTIRRHGGNIITGEIPYDQMALETGELRWKDLYIQADAIVCCEGYQIRQNPWFTALPVKPNKGEVLDIRARGLGKLPFAVTRKVYLVPREGDTWVVGSTYENHFESTGPSVGGKAQILAHLDKVLKVPYEVLDHRAGIRPTSPNRRPIMGGHPRFSRLFTLTGFGTKGMLAAPWASSLMADLLTGKPVELPEEVNISRFKAFRKSR